MKRSFSLKELQSAIDEQASNASRQSMCGGHDGGLAQGDHMQPDGPMEGLAKTLMRRSKSMSSFSEQTSEQMARDGISAGDMVLPSLITMLGMQGVPLDSAHVVEETKRGRGESGKFAGSGLDSPRVAPTSMNDEETLGAASALMQLSSSPGNAAAPKRSPILEKTSSPKHRAKPSPSSSSSAPGASSLAQHNIGSPSQADLSLPSAGLLPPLRDLLGGIAQQHTMQMQAQVGALGAPPIGSPSSMHQGMAMHEAAAAWQQAQEGA
eukprot:CAMPEP_0173405340 /NCGR_PEP_ID=MMETSP1356-20130122/61636_1 /TAXON_ID=77927 ORGANISM="Hemiselmis virescens, Strain PCC157" /NCGR_SAMPLE_ID=MMETSP1356 /ASSEMBLY_ACC=CAM_ASM_000847 /LENGTH=265 /DNA_ID=CAMNT_0014366137 /DNA_START=120 /DNA_END=913 /DNA_ORIENTATION=+